MKHLYVLLLVPLLMACGDTDSTPTTTSPPETEDPRPAVLFDTDANNELDDQHAMMYLLLSDELETVGMTTNATRNGGDISGHQAEAERIRTLSLRTKVPLIAGANGNLPAILPTVAGANYDGKAAVDFIVAASRRASPEKPLVLLPVGKLTNIALALEVAPDIADRVRIVWLGSNYPEPGEYNLTNDTAALNYVLDFDVPLEIVTVRYGNETGSHAVAITQAEVNRLLPGTGPYSEEAVTGRHGGTFHHFGDYSVDLFNHIEYHDPERSRALYDAVAVAILKNPAWGERRQLPAPHYGPEGWEDRPGNPRTLTLWENFDRDAIVEDFYATLGVPVP